MASYGPNFEFQVPPDGKDRNGQCFVPLTGDRIPIGAPIQFTDAAANAMGLHPVQLATSANLGDGEQRDGRRGILVYEHVSYAGYDEAVTTYSNPTITTAPLGAAVQMVSGRRNIVIFKNTVDRTFLTATSVPGRVMVAGVGVATPTVAKGDYLAPGTGNDDDGYYAEVADVDDAWFVVESVNNSKGEVVARMLI